MSSSNPTPLIVSLSPNTDLGYTPINTPTSYPFTIENPNPFPIPFKWKHTIFSISPSQGILPPKSLTKFTISFLLQEATVIIGTVILEAQGEGEGRVFKLSVIGKYSNLGCSREVIDFGAVNVGAVVVRKLVVKNAGVVKAEFNAKITGEKEKESPFVVMPETGQIPPKSSFELTIRYSPTLPNLTYNGNLLISSNSTTTLSVPYHASSIPFAITLTPRSLNFGELKLQTTSTRTLTLQNSSPLPTNYQFFSEPNNNPFSILEFKGTIPPNSSKKIIIQFDPKNTICYYERVYCIVRNHRLLYVDLMGTCYDLLIKPLPIVQIHVDLFRRRVMEGRLSEIDFRYLESGLQMKINRKLELLREGGSLAGLEDEKLEVPEVRLEESEVALHKELFLQGTQNELLTLSTDFIDFGHCDMMTISSPHEVIMTNNLPCKMTIYWINQKRENFSGSYMTAFQIYPESATVKPGASVKFNVTFRPLKSQYFFFQNFQFFALKQGGTKMSKKTLEDYEKKELKTLKPEVTLLRTLKVTQTIQSKVTADLEAAEIMPPMHGVIRCAGNSFGIPSSAYIPIMKISPSKNVHFPPSKIEESTYQTVELINDSDTPTYFKVSHDSGKIFRVFPKAGLIEGKSFQILTIEFTPKTHKLYNTTLPIHLNGSNGNPLLLSLIGDCPEPKLRIPQNRLFFSKCFLGVFSKQTFTVENLSALPVNFRAQIPEKYEDQVFLNVSEKRLESNQILQIELCFIPQFKKQYKVRIPIKITQDERTPIVGYFKPGSAAQSNTFSLLYPPPKEHEYFIEVFGEGGDGSLLLEKQEIDFGVVKVMQQKKTIVKLQNLSDCTFYIEYSLKSNNKQTTNNEIQSSFTLDSAEGILVAKGETLIGITFSPHDVKDFNVSLVVSAREKYPKGLKLPSKNINTPKCVLTIKAQGSYPLLQAVDIRNDSLSVTSLWQSFQLSAFNHSMSTNLTPFQKKYLHIETLPFAESQALQQKLLAFSWDFGYISHKTSSKPRRVLLTIKNFGGIPLDYNFKFPFDNAIEKQIWADPGEPTKEEAYQKAIIAKGIFQVKPKSASLKPGEEKDVELIYTPSSISGSKNANEEHLLKVVLEIKNGKAMVINLKGTTLGPQEGLLVVKKKNYSLPMTPIGMLTPLKFPIEVQNVGSAKVSFNSEIEYEAGEFPEVFGIVNPSGALAPLEKNFVYCTFKPLECKPYKFTVTLRVSSPTNPSLQTVVITLEGQGIDHPISIPKPLKLSKEIPSQRSLVSPLGSKVFFSIEQIDFSIVHPNETAYKMVIIYNLSQSKGLFFDFPEQNDNGEGGFTCGDKFVIEPSYGEILPGEFLELKITLTADTIPSCYEGEIECNVTWGAKDAGDPTSTTNQESEKQTLFLRIKKQTSMPFTNPPPAVPPTPSLPIFSSIFSSIIQSSLNNPALIASFNHLHELPPGILDFIYQDPAVSIENVFNFIIQVNYDEDIESMSNVVVKNEIDNRNYKAMFVNEEFLGTSEIIMENTFFNIVQETTHGENDLMRVTKKFVTGKKEGGRTDRGEEDEEN